jgi:recombinational DNA repair ATPase RecF
MLIKKLHFKNYKRFKDLTIDLGDDPKRIIALVGPNGCGKSSVFDGILFHNSAHSQLGKGSNKDYHYHSLEQIPNYDYQNVKIDFTDGDFIMIKNQKQNSGGKENTIFSFRSPYRYNSNLQVKQSQATDEIWKNNYGATLSSDLDDKIEQSYRRLNIKYTKYLNETDCRPSEAKQHIIGELNDSINKCLDLEITSIGDIEDDRGTLFFRKADHKKDFDFNVLSSGEKEVVDILIDLYLRKDEYSDTVFLIDEPELHINTAIQKKLLLEINKLVGKNCQVWVATHSIGFLRALQDDLKDECQIIQFKGEIKWASEKQELTPIEKTVSNWRNIFETALDDLTGLVSPKTIIYCEGKLQNSLDEKLFDIIFSKKYNDVLFLSSGNKDTVQKYSAVALTVLNKAFSKVKIIALIDRDDNLEEIKNTQVSTKKLNRREFENYLFDKEILKKFCEQNNNTLDEIKFNKEFPDIENADIKSKILDVKALCNFDGSDKDFKENLAFLFTSDTQVFTELENTIFGS